MTDKKISALASGAPAQAGDEYVVARANFNYKLTGTDLLGLVTSTANTFSAAQTFGTANATTVNATLVDSTNIEATNYKAKDGTAAITISNSSGNVDVATNFNFSGTAARITGDLSNSPAINRLAIQSNVTNGSTNLLLLPNGTATTTAINLSGNSSRTNTAIGTIAQTATSFNIDAGITGTGSYVPVLIVAGGAEAVRVDTSRRVGVGGGAPASEDRLSTIGVLPSGSNNSTAVAAKGTVPSTTTSLAVGVNSSLSTDAASFTVSELNGVRVGFSLGAGSSVTDMMGVKVTSAFVGATNAYGVYSDLAAASGRWNFFANGTARNYFAGGVEVVAGTTTMASGFTHIPAAAGAPTGVPTNPTGNVPMYYDTTNNKIYVYNGSWKATAALT